MNSLDKQLLYSGTFNKDKYISIYLYIQIISQIFQTWNHYFIQEAFSVNKRLQTAFYTVWSRRTFLVNQMRHLYSNSMFQTKRSFDPKNALPNSTSLSQVSWPGHNMLTGTWGIPQKLNCSTKDIQKDTEGGPKQELHTLIKWAM